MERVTKYFARFYMPGAFVAETWDVAVAKPDPELIKWPDNAYSFQFYEREEAHDGPEVFFKAMKPVGGTWYHPDSVVESLHEVEKNKNATATLVSNMRINGWKYIVWSRWGNWPQPFNPLEDYVCPRSQA